QGSAFPHGSHAHCRGAAPPRDLHGGPLPRWQPLRDPFRAPRRFHEPRGHQSRGAGCRGARCRDALRRQARAVRARGARQLVQLPRFLGRRGVMNRAALLACLGLPLAAHAYGVQELFQSLSTDKPRRATFQERKPIALLDKPVESSGELVFTPPARLEKRTSKPRAESIVIDGDIATIDRGGKQQTLRLSQYPGIAVLIDSIRSTLA